MKKTVRLRCYQNEVRPRGHADKRILEESDCCPRFPLLDFEKVRDVLQDRGYSVELVYDEPKEEKGK